MTAVVKTMAIRVYENVTFTKILTLTTDGINLTIESKKW